MKISFVGRLNYAILGIATVSREGGSQDAEVSNDGAISRNGRPRQDVDTVAAGGRFTYPSSRLDERRVSYSAEPSANFAARGVLASSHSWPGRSFASVGAKKFVVPAALCGSPRCGDSQGSSRIPERHATNDRRHYPIRLADSVGCPWRKVASARSVRKLAQEPRRRKRSRVREIPPGDHSESQRGRWADRVPISP